MKRSSFFAFAPVVLLACGPGEPPPVEVKDVRVSVPAADPAFLDFVTPEAEVPPGEERMICTDVVYEGEDTAFGEFQGLQGKYGHHLVLLATKAPRPNGTTYDCTDIRTMGAFEPFAFPIGDNLPAGHGSFLPKGKAMVIQMHYVNTGAAPLLVRDVIRLRRMRLDEVSTWASIYVNNHAGFVVPPQSTGSAVTFDCVVPADMKLLVLGGHMHEYGAKYKIELGPDVNSLQPLYEVDAWRAEFRDSPPTNLYLQNPMSLSQGTVIRTTCTWDNPTDKELRFPEEMCATFGFVAGWKDPVVCSLGTW
ncbi:MAG: hypothetical protein ACOZIN_16005 [Myxococcota bacterium]